LRAELDADAMRITAKRPQREQVARDPLSSITCFRRRADDYPFDWHAHAEVELTLILQGRGQRFVGDSVEHFTPGDVVLIGPDTPHTWAFDAATRPMEAVVVQFAPAVFAPGPAEFRPLAALFAEARRGLRIAGRDGQAVAQSLVALAATSDPLARFAGLTAILARILATRTRSPLAMGVAAHDQDARVRELLARLRADDGASVAQLARHLGMGPSVFSRWFRREVGKPCVVYLAELRIGRACELLLGGERAVVDIAFASGFRNLANFNRWFRKVKGMSPTQYRRLAEG
jgi:AraC-like DNA-binding protein/mannose-6-phosphate isomerase-like protein (cupin superfamily)